MTRLYRITGVKDGKEDMFYLVATHGEEGSYLFALVAEVRGADFSVTKVEDITDQQLGRPRVEA